MNSNGSSVWIRCRECSHTSRALAVMLNRVLADRHACPNCASIESPSLHVTQSGGGISLTGECRGLSTAESEFAPNRAIDEVTGFPQRVWRTLTELGGFLAARA